MQRGPLHVSQTNSCFWIISALAASEWFQIKLLTLTLQMCRIPFPKDLAQFLAKLNISSRCPPLITAKCILIFQIDKLLPRGGGVARKELKMACDWKIMRSFHSPYLVEIGCNADFLSRFKVINPGGMKLFRA